MYLSEKPRLVSPMDVNNATLVLSDDPKKKNPARNLLWGEIKLNTPRLYKNVTGTLTAASISSRKVSKSKDTSLMLFLFAAYVIYESYERRWPFADDQIIEKIRDDYGTEATSNIWHLYDLIAQKTGKFINTYKWAEEKNASTVSDQNLIHVRLLLVPLYEIVNLKPSLPLEFD